MNDKSDSYWITELRSAVYISAHKLRKLIKEGVNLNATNCNKNTILHFILQDPEFINDEIVEVLLQSGINVHAKNHIQNTALHYAVLANPTRHIMIQRLLEYGADPNAPNNDGDTSFHCLLAVSRKFDCLETLKMFIRYKGNVNCVNNLRETPLHKSFNFSPDEFRRHTGKVLKELLIQGADVNVYDNQERTPLQAVKSYAYYPFIAKILIEYGARFQFEEIGSFYGKDEQEYKDIDKLLIKYENVEVQDWIDIGENCFHLDLCPLDGTSNSSNLSYKQKLSMYRKKCSNELKKIENDILPLRNFKKQIDEACIGKLIEIYKIDKKKYPIYNDVLYHMVVLSKVTWICKIKQIIKLLKNAPLYIVGLQNMKERCWKNFEEFLSPWDLFCLAVVLDMLVKQQTAPF